MRLLHFIPGDEDQELRGVIVHVSTNSSRHVGRYRALSYVWGTDGPTDKLITPDGIVAISPSLGRALRCLRQRTQLLVLWVDAVCINQSNNAEKAEQIRLLPRIFQSAEFVYAFWGPFEGHGDAAAEMLMQVLAKANVEEHSRTKSVSDCTVEEAPASNNASTENEGGWPKELARIPASWNDERIPRADDPVWDSVETLFSCSWFRRAWIVQETVTAAEVRVVCGKWLIDFGDLHQAVQIVHSETQASAHISSRFQRLGASLEPFLMLATQREWELEQHRWALISLLEHFRHLESTLSRDRFFALLGLASDANEPEFAPDYDSPFEAIVIRFARVFVRQGRGMQMLHRAGLNSHSHRFPSWIPDWTIKRPLCLHESDERSVPFFASGPTEPQVELSLDTDELIAGGFEVDVIQQVSVSSNTEREWKQYLEEVDAMIDAATLAAVPEPREDLKWKVPIAGTEYPNFITPGGLDLKPSYKALREYLDTNNQTQIDSGTRSNPSLAQYAADLNSLCATTLQQQSASYASVLRDVVSGWRFVVTERGYVGVAPGLTKVGDTIAILKGGRVPFVIRNSGDRTGSSRLVGECYIHGLMHGEGLTLEVVERDFRLH
jgi:hypothetical protein